MKLNITEFPYEINPVTDGLELDFNPTGRTNQDSDYNVFYNNAKNAEGNEIPVTWTLSDNFDWVNGGWKTDANGDSYFCIKAGTFVDINYSLFNDNNTVAKTSTAADGSIIYSKGNGKEFKIVFKKLFKGGEGVLELTDPNDILNTGIEISALPPGKKLNSIALLSGGEKTLTAIALLFAILNVKPVPFVILDEVEAALDEANVDAFGSYLLSRKERSQFIIITHKKRTMEYADALYGITMQESGVSKLVSVKLEG